MLTFLNTMTLAVVRKDLPENGKTAIFWSKNRHLVGGKSQSSQKAHQWSYPVTEEFNELISGCNPRWIC